MKLFAKLLGGISSVFALLGAYMFMAAPVAQASDVGTPVVSLSAPSFFAAITWNFSTVTDELGGLGTALVAVVGVVITALLAFWGVKRSIKPILGIVSKLFS